MTNRSTLGGGALLALALLLIGLTVLFDHALRGWRVETPRRAWNAPIVVIATGWADFPHVPAWPGQAQYRGDVIHSSSYRNPCHGAKLPVIR